MKRKEHLQKPSPSSLIVDSAPSEAGDSADKRPTLLPSLPSDSATKSLPNTPREPSAHRKATLDFLSAIAAAAPDAFERRSLAIHLVRAHSPKGKAGRRLSPQTSAALEMREQGKRWSAIYAAVIPNYATLSGDQRQHEQEALRRRVHARRRYLRKRSRQGG